MLNQIFSNEQGTSEMNTIEKTLREITAEDIKNKLLTSIGDYFNVIEGDETIYYDVPNDEITVLNDLMINDISSDYCGDELIEVIDGESLEIMYSMGDEINNHSYYELTGEEFAEYLFEEMRQNFPTHEVEFEIDRCLDNLNDKKINEIKQ